MSSTFVPGKPAAPNHTKYLPKGATTLDKAFYAAVEKIDPKIFMQPLNSPQVLELADASNMLRRMGYQLNGEFNAVTRAITSPTASVIEQALTAIQPEVLNAKRLEDMRANDKAAYSRLSPAQREGLELLPEGDVRKKAVSAYPAPAHHLGLRNS